MNLQTICYTPCSNNVSFFAQIDTLREGVEVIDRYRRRLNPKEVSALRNGWNYKL